MVKCIPEFEYFTAFLKNKNIIFKTRRSKVTDYAALNATHNVTSYRLKAKLKFRIVTCQFHRENIRFCNLWENRTPTCASMQSDQHLCYCFKKYIQSFNTLLSRCDWVNRIKALR